MPPDGRCAIVPPDQRPQGPLSRHTIDRLSEDTFKRLTSILASPSNWIDVAPTLVPSEEGPWAEEETEAAPPSLPPAELAVLERDLQKVLSRNLGRIEKGLTEDPEYQLEEYPCDVGRMDLLCRDAQNNWVVVELKADWAGDDAVGQILGYMSWIRDNLPNGSTVRGFIICKNATGRVKAAARLFPALSIKRFTLDCKIDDIN